MIVREGGLDDPQVIALLDLHARGMLANSPPGTCHFLDLAGLNAPDISFLSIWDGDILLGIGALRQLDAFTGEIKSMRTAQSALGRGVGTAMLNHIVALAHRRGYTALKLETGTGSAFDAAHALYARHGFAPCPAFAGYQPTPFNRFMSLAL